MNGRTKDPSLLESAGRGALAGLIGGAAMAAAERFVLPRLPDRRAPRVATWDARMARAARRAGWNVSPRSRTALGVGTQLALASLLGAAYAVARDHLDTSRAGQELLDAGLAFAVSAFAPELPRARRPVRMGRRGLRQRVERRVLSPITPPAIYGRATALALQALGR